MFDTKPYEEKMNATVDHFEAELKKIRTGRAHPDMLDSVQVEVYGTRMPLNQVANVTTADGQMLQVTAFDLSNLKAISDAIRTDQSLGFNPSDDGRIIRVPIPALTEERRREIAKQLGDKVEDCRIALRNVRQDAFKDAKRAKDAKELSEDDAKRVEKDVDTTMQQMQSRIDAATAAKEKEIMMV